MRLKALLCILILFGVLNTKAVLAQQDKSFNVPSSPAFSILGFEPTSVMRPGSPKELSTDLLNSLDKRGNLLINVGIEVAPYWLKSRPYLSREEYFNPNVQQSFFQSLLISAATVRDSITGENKLGAGARFKLINGRVTDEYLELQRKLNAEVTLMAAVAASKAFIGTTINSRTEALEFVVSTLKEAGYSETVINSFNLTANERLPNFDDSPNGINSFVQDLNNLIDNNNSTLKKQVAELSRKRVGFILEVAGASSFARSASSITTFEKAGVWVNASNVVSETDALNFSLRYFFTNAATDMTNFDAGISYNKELSKFSISFESMLRRYKAEISEGNLPAMIEKDFTYRIALQSAYRISDYVNVNTSLGKNFATPFISGSSYFSIFGLSYNLFNKSRVNLASEEL